MLRSPRLRHVYPTNSANQRQAYLHPRKPYPKFTHPTINSHPRLTPNIVNLTYKLITTPVRLSYIYTFIQYQIEYLAHQLLIRLLYLNTPNLLYLLLRDVILRNTQHHALHIYQHKPSIDQFIPQESQLLHINSSYLDHTT